MSQSIGIPSSLGDDGFTLIEVLIALVILAIATASLIGAAEGHIDSIRSMQTRAAAQWVAENRIAELTISPEAAPTAGEIVVMLGQSWAVKTSKRASDDPDLEAMTISVAPPEATEPVVTMDFFVERQRAEAQ
jgi:general secretion pathway protein I